MSMGARLAGMGTTCDSIFDGSFFFGSKMEEDPISCHSIWGKMRFRRLEKLGMFEDLQTKPSVLSCQLLSSCYNHHNPIIIPS